MLEDAAGIRRVVIACGYVDLRKGIDGLSMIIGDRYHQYYQLCADCLCGDFTGRIFNYDRSHYVYQCAGAEERDRNIKGNGRIEEECISGV